MDPVAAQDPAYLSFMRGAGYDEAEVLANLARQQGQLDRQLQRSAPRFKDQLRQASDAVQTDYTNRGFYRSGARMVGQVDAENDVRRQEGEYRAGITDQQSDLTANAMQAIAAGRRGAADQALAGRQAAALAAANAGVGLGAFGGVGAGGNSGGDPNKQPALAPPKPRVVKPNPGFRQPYGKASTVGGRGAI